MRQREEVALGCSQKTPPREGLGGAPAGAGHPSVGCVHGVRPAPVLCGALTAGRGGCAGAPVSTEGSLKIQGFSWRVVSNRRRYHLEPDVLVIIFLVFILSPGSAVRGVMRASQNSDYLQRVPLNPHNPDVCVESWSWE